MSNNWTLHPASGMKRNPWSDKVKQHIKYSQLFLRQTLGRGQHYVSILDRCPSYRAETKQSKERQGPTLGVCFSEVSVKRELAVPRNF